MKIALVQSRLTQDLEANLTLALEGMRHAGAAGAEVVCFPEIQLSPFFPQFPHGDATRWEVTLEHDAVRAFREACRRLNLVAFPNVYLRSNGSTYDATVVIDERGEILGVSEMVHVVRAPCFYEQDYYRPSESGFHVYETVVGRIGVVICFDRHFPEAIRTCALRGADVIVIPTANTKDEDMELFEWELRTAAVQNGVFIAMCNRVGLEGGMDFAGESIVIGPGGEVLAKADDTPQILHAELDLTRIREERRRRPYLKLRRPASYER